MLSPSRSVSLACATRAAALTCLVGLLPTQSQGLVVITSDPAEAAQFQVGATIEGFDDLAALTIASYDDGQSVPAANQFSSRDLSAFTSPFFNSGGASFNNLFDTARHVVASSIDFAAHAAAMGATAEKVGSIAELGEAMGRACASDRSYVVVIDTDPLATTEAGGHWWDVAVPEVSGRAEVRAARKRYETHRELQRLAD